MNPTCRDKPRLLSGVLVVLLILSSIDGILKAEASRLLTIEHNNGATLLARYASTLDPDGNRTQTIITGSAVPNQTDTATYNTLDQLTTATYGSGSSVSYTYDANGNRLAQTSGGGTTSSTYNDADQLTATSGAFSSSSTYDAAGNRTSVSYGSGGTDTFAYDWNNRLSSATVGGSSVFYGYSGDDLRTSRTEGGITESYLWDRLTALPTMVSDGTTQTVHGPQGVANEITSGTAAYPLQDGLGSTRAWTNSAGTATGSSDWDLWGNLQSATGVTGLHGFTGERQDPTTNLVYLRARDYSPGTARFVQPDPVQPNSSSPQGYNPYWYANNNPATLTDPAGLQAADLVGAAPGGITASTSIAVGLTVVAGQIEALVATFGLVAEAMVIALLAMPLWAMVLVLVAVLVVFAIYMDATNRCRGFLCTGSLTGFIGVSIDWTISGGRSVIQSRVTGAVGAVAACAVALSVSSLLLPSPVASQCSTPRECVQELVEEVPELGLGALTGQQIEIPNTLVGAAAAFNGGSSEGSGPCDPDPCERYPQGSGKGGVYVLIDPSNANVPLYVGRTNNFDRREAEHKRSADKSGLRMVRVFYTDNLALQLGIEQSIYQGMHPPLNKINPIAPGRADFRDLVERGRNFMNCHPTEGWNF